MQPDVRCRWYAPFVRTVAYVLLGVTAPLFACMGSIGGSTPADETQVDTGIGRIADASAGFSDAVVSDVGPVDSGLADAASTSDTGVGPADLGFPDGGFADTGADAGVVSGVPMFVAIGHGGRRVVSCDDGRTWQGDCTTDGQADPGCFVENDGSNHASWSGQAVAYGDGAFLALFGWFGQLSSAQVLRSEDGRTWENVFGGPGRSTGNFGSGISFGNGAFVINAQGSRTHRTVDRGASWATTSFDRADLPIRRTLIFIPYRTQQGVGRFVSYGDEGRVTYSDDNGQTWQEATSNCSFASERILTWGNGILVASGWQGTCASTDGGLTWQIRNANRGPGNVVFTGTDFYIAYGNTAFRSPDGVNWQSISIGPFPQGAGPQLLGSNLQGLLVGVSADGDRFYRSTNNGTSWTETTGSAGIALTSIAFGYGQPSGDCPRR